MGRPTQTKTWQSTKLSFKWADHRRPKSKHPHFLPFKPTDHRRPLIRQPCSFKWADQRRPKHDNLQSCLSNGQTIADQSQNILIYSHSNPETIADPWLDNPVLSNGQTNADQIMTIYKAVFQMGRPSQTKVKTSSFPSIQTYRPSQTRD